MKIKYQLSEDDYMNLYGKHILKRVILSKIMLLYSILIFAYVFMANFLAKQGELRVSIVIVLTILAIITPIIIVKVLKFKFKQKLKGNSRVLGESILNINDEFLEITKTDENGVVCNMLKFNKNEIYDTYEDEKYVYILKDKSLLIEGIPKSFMNLEQIHKLLELSKDKG